MFLPNPISSSPKVNAKLEPFQKCASNQYQEIDSQNCHTVTELVTISRSDTFIYSWHDNLADKFSDDFHILSLKIANLLIEYLEIVTDFKMRQVEDLSLVKKNVRVDYTEGKPIFDNATGINRFNRAAAQTLNRGHTGHLGLVRIKYEITLGSDKSFDSLDDLVDFLQVEEDAILKSSTYFSPVS